MRSYHSARITQPESDQCATRGIPSPTLGARPTRSSCPLSKLPSRAATRMSGQRRSLMRLALALATSLAIAALADAAGSIRVATFNCSLNRNNAGDLINDLSTPDNAQAAAVAEIIQRIDPDIILLNEFDYDANFQAAQLFQ